MLLTPKTQGSRTTYQDIDSQILGPRNILSTIRICVNYQTNFGFDLWLVGQPDFLNSWNADQNDGRGGVQMKWSEGHMIIA